jgi:hypothetical protein
MTEYLDLSPTIVGPEVTDVDTGSSGIWVIVEQDQIPQDQQQVTEQEANSMLQSALAGLSAFRGLSTCPVRRQSRGPGKHFATYTATILIHKSNLLDDYDFTVTKDGVPIPHSTPRRTYRYKSESFDIDYNQTVQLRWQPFSGFQGLWNEQFGVWDTKSSRVSPLNTPSVEQYDGFLTLKGDLVFGIIKASALAVMDLVTVDIEHQLGQQWGSSVRAEVRWPAGADPEFQENAECEVLIPACAKDAFEECATVDSDGFLLPGVEIPGLPEDGEGGFWQGYYDSNPNGPTKVFWNKCTQQVIEVTNDNRDTL